MTFPRNIISFNISFICENEVLSLNNKCERTSFSQIKEILNEMRYLKTLFSHQHAKTKQHIHKYV